MIYTHAIRDARWAVVEALTARLRAENDAELARLKEELAERCREYNTLTQHQFTTTERQQA